jgi:hypothetical protein
MAHKVPLDPDVKDLLDALDAAGAQYVIIGAHAMGAHGIIRATGDFDLLVRPTADNSTRVHRALIEFGAPLYAHGVAEDYFSAAERVYQMGLPPRRIDLLTSISGVEPAEAFDTAFTVRIGSKNRKVLSVETLIKNKQATGRPKDKLDVPLLKKVLQESGTSKRGKKK